VSAMKRKTGDNPDALRYSASYALGPNFYHLYIDGDLYSGALSEHQQLLAELYLAQDERDRRYVFYLTDGSDGIAVTDIDIALIQRIMVPGATRANSYKKAG
jgi:hypothetical protein